jgi:predicted lipid carrier protein YhbT
MCRFAAHVRAVRTERAATSRSFPSLTGSKLLSNNPAYSSPSRSDRTGGEMTTAHEDGSLPAIVRRILPPLPATPLGPLLSLSLRALARRQPGLFERLGEHCTARYLIDPTDLSFAFSIVPDGTASVVRVTGKSGSAPCDVVIRGPLLMLLGILDGTLDGDALFFHRTITVSGRTEAVVALRNAIEDAELRPSDLLGLRGLLARIADAGVTGTLSAARSFAADATTAETRPI